MTNEKLVGSDRDYLSIFMGEQEGNLHVIVLPKVDEKTRHFYEPHGYLKYLWSEFLHSPTAFINGVVRQAREKNKLFILVERPERPRAADVQNIFMPLVQMATSVSIAWYGEELLYEVVKCRDAYRGFYHKNYDGPTLEEKRRQQAEGWASLVASVASEEEYVRKMYDFLLRPLLDQKVVDREALADALKALNKACNLVQKAIGKEPHKGSPSVVVSGEGKMYSFAYEFTGLAAETLAKESQKSPTEPS